MRQLLLVEDEKQIRELITEYFREKAPEFEIVSAKNGHEGIELIENNSFDLVMLDIMMPGIDGFEVCKKIRKNNIVPILFLTALGNEKDILYGYSLGCDDYMVKPFSLAQLLAKVRALINRSCGNVISKSLSMGKLVMDKDRFAVFVDEEKIELPPKEYELLKLFMENPHRIFSRDELLVRLWADEMDVYDRVVDNHVKILRRALGNAGRYIKTSYKRGYYLETEERKV